MCEAVGEEEFLKKFVFLIIIMLLVKTVFMISSRYMNEEAFLENIIAVISENPWQCLFNLLNDLENFPSNVHEFDRIQKTLTAKTSFSQLAQRMRCSQFIFIIEV